MLFSRSVCQFSSVKEGRRNGPPYPPSCGKIPVRHTGTSYRLLNAGSTFYPYLIRLSVKRERCAIGYFFGYLSKNFNSLIECFHVTSRRPCWCPQTKKRRPCWCPQIVLWELNSILLLTFSFPLVENMLINHVSETTLLMLNFLV